MRSESASAAPRARQDLAVCLSIATFLYFRIWTELLSITPGDQFHMALPPPPAAYWAAIAGTLCIGGLFWGLVSLVRRRPTPVRCLLVYIGFICSAVLCANALRSVVARRWHFGGGDMLRVTGTIPFIVACAALGLVIVIVSSIWPRQIVRLAYRAFLVSFPFVLLVFGQALWAITRYDASPFANRAPAAVLPVKAGAPRVVWVVFDELDQNITFDRRPVGLELPELDRFRAESIYAPKAYSPSGSTIVSMPSLIGGSPLSRFDQRGPGSMSVMFEGASGWREWSAADTIFGEARRLGFNTALVGWYLPYCRVLNAELTRCWWCEMERQINSAGETFDRLVPNQARTIFETSVLSPFGQSLVVRRKAAQYSAMMAEAISVVADPSIGLALLHMNVPHAPFVYDRQARDMSIANAPVRGYTDAVALVDVTLGELRRAMQKNGLWDSSVVIVTSDHFNRDGKLFHGAIDRRVPFMIKMPGQTSGEVFGHQLNTIVSREFIAGILAGRVRTPADAASWLMNRRSTQSAADAVSDNAN
jgi:hypothetical protein